MLRKEFYEVIDGGAGRVSPQMLSSRLLDTLDPEHEVHELIRHGCDMEFRQVARKICSAAHNSAQSQAEQSEMFAEDMLQVFYPVGGDEYCRRDLLTPQQYEHNENRLEKEGKIKLQHSRVLREERILKLNINYWNEDGTVRIPGQNCSPAHVVQNGDHAPSIFSGVK